MKTEIVQSLTDSFEANAQIAGVGKMVGLGSGSQREVAAGTTL